MPFAKARPDVVVRMAGGEPRTGVGEDGDGDENSSRERMCCSDRAEMVLAVDHKNCRAFGVYV